MSKSRKKTPIFGHCSGSEKEDKRIANRMFRRISKNKIQSEKFEQLPVNMNQILSLWEMSKDGKYCWKEGLNWEGGILMRK